MTEVTYEMYNSLSDMLYIGDRDDKDLACTIIWRLCNSSYVDQIKLIRDDKVKILNRRLINALYDDDLCELKSHFESM